METQRGNNDLLKVIQSVRTKLGKDESSMNSSGALSDVAPEGESMAQKDWAGFHSAVHRVPRNWNELHCTDDNRA